MFIARLGQRKSQRPSSGEPSRDGALVPAVSVAELDAIPLRVELPVQLRMQERDVVPLEVVVGVRLPVAREVVSRRANERHGFEREVVHLGEEVAEILLQRRGRGVQVDEDLPAPRGDLNRVQRELVGVERLAEVAAERNRPSNAYAHPWYWHTRFAQAPAPSSTSGPARCRHTLWKPRSTPSLPRTTINGHPAYSCATYVQGSATSASFANQSHSLAKMFNRSRS